jgi:hypothetical protein
MNVTLFPSTSTHKIECIPNIPPNISHPAVVNALHYTARYLIRTHVLDVSQDILKGLLGDSVGWSVWHCSRSSRKN